MEIRINRKLVIVVTAIAAIVVGVAVVFIPAGNLKPYPEGSIGTRLVPPKTSSTALVIVTTPEEANVGFAKAFYVVDYADYEGWLAALKQASTDDGFAILTRSIAPAVWPEIEKAMTVTPLQAVDAQDAGLLLEGDSQIGGQWQIRKLNVHVDAAHLWPTMKETDFTAIVMLGQQDGEWRFVSFMTPEQIDQIKGGQ